MMFKDKQKNYCYCIKTIFFLITLRLKANASNLLSSVLTFELEGGEQQCFYDDVQAGYDASLLYRVIDGDESGIDVIVKDENVLQMIYEEHRELFDSVDWTIKFDGTIKMCFSNEFSSVTKIVYIDYEKEKSDLGGLVNQPFDLLNTQLTKVQDNLRAVYFNQTTYKLIEFKNRKISEELNWRILFRSFVVTFIMIIVGVGQVMFLKRLFESPSYFQQPSKKADFICKEANEIPQTNLYYI